jgi:hypothetical protein
LTERTIWGEEVRVRITVVGALIDCVSIPSRQLPDLDVVERREGHDLACRCTAAYLRANNDGQDTDA